MQEFNIWLEVGFTHILSIEGIDHLLFILSLTLLYNYNEYKKLFLLISGFTLGHTLSLIYCTLNNTSFNVDVIEFLIPLTIIISAVSNFVLKNKNIYKLCMLTILFGLLHGLAFSESIKSLLSDKNQIIIPIIAFNMGIEIAQIVLFSIYLALSILLIKLTRINQTYFNKALSALIAGSGLIMCYNKLIKIQ